MVRWHGEYVTGTSEGIDFDAPYQVSNFRGVAWRLLGWEPQWEPSTTLVQDESGNEWEEETSEGEWIANIGGRIAARMVGDDAIHYVERDNLELLDEEGYCPTCGQTGCHWH